MDQPATINWEYLINKQLNIMLYTSEQWHNQGSIQPASQKCVRHKNTSFFWRQLTSIQNEISCKMYSKSVQSVYNFYTPQMTRSLRCIPRVISSNNSTHTSMAATMKEINVSGSVISVMPKGIILYNFRNMFICFVMYKL